MDAGLAIARARGDREIPSGPEPVFARETSIGHVPRPKPPQVRRAPSGAGPPGVRMTP